MESTTANFDSNSLREAVDIRVLKNLMDAFAAAHHIGAGIFTPDLTRIVSASNHMPFCQLLRDARRDGCAYGNRLCHNTDRKHFPSQGRTVGPYLCHAGNWDFAVPIVTKNGTVIGAIYGGQVRKHPLEASEVNALMQLADECGVDKAELLSRAAALPVMSDEELARVVQLTEGISHQIADLVDKRAREHTFLLRLLNAPDLRALLSFAVDYAQSVLAAASCSIFLRRTYEGRDVWRLEYTSSSHLRAKQDGGTLSCDWYESGEGLTGWVAERNESLRLDDLHDQHEIERKGIAPKWKGKILETSSRDEVKRFLAVPLGEAGTAAAEGVIRAVATISRPPFEEGDTATLRSLARLIWNALEAVRSREHAQRGKEAMELLATAAKLTSSDLYPQEVLKRMIKSTLDVLHKASPTSIYILAHDTAKGEFMIAHGGGEGLCNTEIGRRFSTSKGIAGHVLREKLEYYIAPDVANDPYYHEVVSMGSALVVPIWSEAGQLTHVVSVGSPMKHAFTEEDARLLAAYSQHMAIAFRNALVHEEACARLELQRMALAAFSAETSAGPICDAIVGICKDRLHAATCSLFLLIGGSQLVLASSTDLELKKEQEETGGVCYDLREGLTGYTACRPPGTVIRILSIDDVEELESVGRGVTPQNKHPEKSLDPLAKQKSFIGMPIHFGKDLVGVIRLAQKEGSITFLEEDEPILRALASQAGICLKFAEALREKDLSLKGFAHDAAGTPVCNLLDDTELLLTDGAGVSLGSLSTETVAIMKRMRLYAIHLGMLMDTYILIGTGVLPQTELDIPRLRVSEYVWQSL